MGEMNSAGCEKLKTLIEIDGRLDSKYSDITALPAFILESVMRLVACESSLFYMFSSVDGTLRTVASAGREVPDNDTVPVAGNSIAGWVASNNQHVIINTRSPGFQTQAVSKTAHAARTVMAVPVRVGTTCIGVVELRNKTENRKFDKTDLEVLDIFCSHAGIVYSNAAAYHSARDEIAVLQARMAAGRGYHAFVAGKSPVTQDLLHMIETAAGTDSPVLITGEHGTGKELLAEQLHLKSRRGSKPFIRVNCAAVPHLPPEAAEEGTLFLDEISALSGEQQRILVDFFKSVRSATDLRIVAATASNLEKMVAAGTFSGDLYYRLSVLPVNVPPLRERRDDIEPLSFFFLDRFSMETKKKFSGFSDAALQTMTAYYWPGNVRELKNAVERACVLGKPPLVQAEDLRLDGVISGHDDGISRVRKAADELGSAPDGDRTLKAAVNRFKKAYVMRILDETAWNQTATGKILGIQRTYVSRLLNELHIRDVK